MTTEKMAVQVRMTREMVDRLDREADARLVSRNRLLERAVEDYLDRLLDIDQVLATTPDPEDD